MPKISIIIPAYNYAHYISQSLDCLINQTFKDWECIIVDDGSLDNTKQVVEIYLNKDSRFKYYFKQNGGLSSARNFGIDRVVSKYVCFLDADDILEPNFLFCSFYFLENLNKEAVVFQKFIKFFDDKSSDYLWYKDYNYNIGFQSNFFQRLVINNSLPPCSPMFPISIIKNNNFRFDETLTSYEDWDFWLKIAEKYPFYFIENDNSAARVRFHSNSMSTNNWRMDINQLKVRLKLNNTLVNSNLISINYIGIESCVKTLLYSIADCLDNKEINNAKSKLLQLIEIYPHKKIKILNKNFFYSHPKLFRKTSWILWERIKNIIK
ncbi:MAG: glycosyltransferase family 2 protein [Bacteroidales bacterium]|nr:glycosyltransferase family 2 protein [Bacteroidales bacterium]